MFNCPLEELREYEDLKTLLDKGQGPLLLSGCIDSEKVHIAGRLAEAAPLRLWVTYNDAKAAEIAEDASCFGEDALIYPAKDLLFYQADVHGNLLVRQRMAVMKRLLDTGGGTIVTTIDALMERIAPWEALESSVMELKTGGILDTGDFAAQMTALGYERYTQVDGIGQFAVRGGIIDIFPLTEEHPVRIELWGDEIDSIRIFDEETQRSLENIDSIRIYPAAEAEKQPGEGVSFIDYLPAGTVILLDEPARLLEKGRGIANEFQESMLHRLENGYADAASVPELFTPEEVFEEAGGGYCLALTGIGQSIEQLDIKKSFYIQAQAVPSYQSRFDNLIQDLKTWKRGKARVVLLSGSETRAERLAADLREYDISAFATTADEAGVMPGQVLVTSGNLHKGFAYPMMSFYVLSEGDLFGRERKKRRRRSTYDGLSATEFSQLAVGDYVVHENHGLGIYQGTEHIERDGIARDYMKITYGDGGNLYIPVTQMNLVRKYADADAEKTPKLNRLSGTEWHRTKSKVRTEVREIAEDLVRLYAARQGGRGFTYGPDTVWQREFEEQFPYEETDDQIAAIEATKADMESGRIMDRLICGDVGFGKTEIAIRAAFKAVQEGKQVVYLVPTTILAQQHYNTFAQRLKDYPVTVDLLCRFRTPTQQKNTVSDLRRGRVDIVIGTHRLLSADVGFKDLGLLIIDEEQRFGVSDKEKIKKLKENVDVLSLTATPIPRTLHMSLIGVRDMSILKEAPLDRMPIQTYVMEYNDELVREAITRELARGGQVYYVYNKVNNIADITGHIAELVPDAVVVYAHGQMRERELEQIMLDFINGEIDVLVSTTIVETGIDISNVNTILIHDADRFGLAQLYQLRGRVGRSNRTAYAFLMYRRDRMLKEVAEKRLSTIREYTELGSGIKIAMRDLELRGAGNILGAQQHGHMEAVGYDLYCKLLGNAVRELRGVRKESEDFETEIDITIDAYLPGEYIRGEGQRMSVYQRIAGIETGAELEDMQDELTDRFGELPPSVENLLEVALIKAKAHAAYVEEITGNRDTIRFKMYKKAPVRTEAVGELLAAYKGDLKAGFGGKMELTYTDQRRRIVNDRSFLETIGDILEDIDSLIQRDEET